MTHSMHTSLRCSRHNSTTTYQDWLAPTGAAAGVVGAEAIHEQREGKAEVASRTRLERQNSSFAPTVDSEGAFVAAANVESNGTDAVTTGGGTSQTEPSNATATLNADNGQRTDDPFPSMNRRDTDMSVSNLHIPGEYPRQGSMAA